ncbi:unnamed protein product, partial [Laminaria digitata]
MGMQSVSSTHSMLQSIQCFAHRSNASTHPMLRHNPMLQHVYWFNPFVAATLSSSTHPLLCSTHQAINSSTTPTLQHVYWFNTFVAATLSYSTHPLLYSTHQSIDTTQCFNTSTGSTHSLLQHFLLQHIHYCAQHIKQSIVQQLR